MYSPLLLFLPRQSRKNEEGKVTRETESGRSQRSGGKGADETERETEREREIRAHSSRDGKREWGGCKGRQARVRRILTGFTPTGERVGWRWGGGERRQVRDVTDDL